MSDYTPTSAALPSVTVVNFDWIPDPLKELPQWVGWQLRVRDGRRTKVPVQPNGRVASVSDPASWSSFEAVQAAYLDQPSQFAGVGFVLTPVDPYFGVDLDACLIPNSRRVTPWARDILHVMPTYTEVSPSGNGLKLIGIGQIPRELGSRTTFRKGLSAPTGVDKTPEIAGWDRLRFFAITGQVFVNRRTIRACQAGLDTVHQQYWAPRSRAVAGATTASPDARVGGDANEQALTAMLRVTRNFENENDGSRRLLACACRCVEFDLDDQEAVVTIRQYEQTRPFPRQYSDEEILQRVRDAETRCQRGEKLVLRNYRLVTSGSGEGGKLYKEPLRLSEVLEHILWLTAGWPRRVEQSLFVHDLKHGISSFSNNVKNRVFGWLQRSMQIDWETSGRFISKDEVCVELERTAQVYSSIEYYPHEPIVDGVYYACSVPDAGSGEHLQGLLDRFNPETELDRHLLQAALMTVIWGGRPGARPAFLITAPSVGRGAGKTILATKMTELVGGAVTVTLGDGADKIQTRLLSPSGRFKRCGLLDNPKGRRLSWDFFESLVSAGEISGRQLYAGEGQRPNLLTWFLTMNGPSMSTDMAQRVVPIHIAAARFAGGWVEETDRFIADNRESIIGDLIAALRQPAAVLPQLSRWASWEQGVLAKLPDAQAAQALIVERQGAINIDMDEAEHIEAYFRERLERLRYISDTETVRIRARVAAEWYADATGANRGTAVNSRALLQMIDEGQLQRLFREAGRTHGRCYLWRGQFAPADARPAEDLERRLSQYG